MRPLTLPSPPMGEWVQNESLSSGGEGIETAPSPSERGRDGGRVALARRRGGWRDRGIEPAAVLGAKQPHAVGGQRRDHTPPRLARGHQQDRAPRPPRRGGPPRPPAGGRGP